MKKYQYFIAPTLLLVAFIVFTVLVKTVDMFYLSNGTYVGMWGMNEWVYSFACNINKASFMKTVSDVLMYISFVYAAGMVGIGVYQLIKAKSLKGVSLHLYILYGAYAVMAVFFLMFEIVKINYAPNFLELKASYPSSHVLFVSVIYLCSSLTATELLGVDGNRLIKGLLITVSALVCVLIGFLRILAVDKHWFSDVVASYLLASFIVCLYHAVKRWFIPLEEKKEEETSVTE